MSARFLPFVAGSLFTAAVVLVGVRASSAQQPAPPPPVVQQPVAAPAAPAPAAAAPRAVSPMFQGEQQLDTSGGPALVAAAPPAPNAVRRVRTPADETLPKWVPQRGRLTVVESSDLAENLGLVPRGTTKKSAERISVQDKLDEESSRAKSDPSGTYAFSVKAHIKNHR